MKVGAQGQIIIPKKLRDKYGLLPNVEIDIIPATEGLRIKRKVSQAHAVNRVYGILKKKNASTDTYIESIRGK